MKKIISIFASLLLIFGCSSFAIIENPDLLGGYAHAAESTDDMTNIIKCGNQDGVVCILKLVLNIMTYGIGVLGVVGIVISGIQYITSQGDAGKMAKAKNRIIQVVIGLVIYALMYAALYFLVPGFNTDALDMTNSGSGSSSSSSSTPTAGSRTSTSYTSSDIQDNLSYDSDSNELVLKYSDSESARIKSTSSVTCPDTNNPILQITYARGGRDERKITMESQEECEFARTYIQRWLNEL